MSVEELLKNPLFKGLLAPPEEINDEHKTYSVAAACIVLGVISTLMVVGRLGHRAKTKTMGADDWAMIPSILLYIGWTVLAGYMNLNAGVGKPLWEITVAEYEIWFQGIIVCAWFYPIVSAAIRVSIILFYLRIFGHHNRSVKWSVYILLALQGVYIIVFSILPIFICDPVAKFWKPLERSQYCSDLYYYYTQVALFSVSLIFDVILLVFPIFPVAKLQLPLRKKVGVAAIFMLGAAASIAAAYKLAIFVLQMERYIPSDPTWLQYLMSRFVPGQFDLYGTTFWIPTQMEPTVALMGASIPALYQLFTTSVPRFRTVVSIRSTGKLSGSDTNNLSSSRPRNNDFKRMNESEVELHLVK